MGNLFLKWACSLLYLFVSSGENTLGGRETVNAKGWGGLVFLVMLAVSTYVGAAYLGARDLGGQRGVDAGSIVTAPSSTRRYCVTLVTGDVVVVSDLAEGRKGVSIMPADPSGGGQNFVAYDTPGGTYVIPSDVDLAKLDVELFNVAYLIREEYYERASLPVIVSLVAGEQGSQMDDGLPSLERVITGFHAQRTASFPRLSAVAVALPQDTIKDSVQTLVMRPDVEKIWLDRKRRVDLDASVPLIGAPELWAAGYDGTGSEIAILDTGIDATHPDLDDLDDDVGTVDPKVVREIDFTDDASVEDLAGHGTHCAGIAAGTGAASGGTYTGVAPGAFLWNVKVLNQYGWGYDSWIILGIEYAAYGPDGLANTGDEADVISMSLGGAPTDGADPLSLAVDAAVDAGVVVVVAAGNAYDYFEVESPGAARNSITVGASDVYDDIAAFSSRGPTIDFRVKPDVLAPGVAIASSVPYSMYGSYYQSQSGTSMATPHVAGAAALMLQGSTPPGWTPPRYVKHTLIATAVDLGLDVFTQGGGRIHVPSALDTQILVDPATVSLGLHGDDVFDNTTLTFFNLNETSHRVLSLEVAVHDIYTEALVDCAVLNTTILDLDPGSNASVLLTVDTSVSSSIYSGRIVASIDTGETVHAIFGFARLHEVTVTKVDRAGAPAAFDEVHLIGDRGAPGWQSTWTDEHGNATFYVGDGTFHVISSGWEGDIPIYTLEENRTINGDTEVSLDEANSVAIGFDAKKPDQILAEKTTKLFYDGYSSDHRIVFFSIASYPVSALAYMGPTAFNTAYTYSYYPEAHYTPGNPDVIDTPEWHKLLYTLEDVAGNTTFEADYDTLVRRTTDYKVAKTADFAERVQFVYDPIAGFDSTFMWGMSVPQRRVEWLSPEPTYYEGWYSKWNPRWDWDFEAPPRLYPSGADVYHAFGEHPFTSGTEVDVGSGYLRVEESISEDTFGNSFLNQTRSLAGSLTIIQDGVEAYSTEIGDRFSASLSFAGTPDFRVIIEGGCDLSFSTSTRTELTFTGDATQDYEPPHVTLRPSGSDLYCVVPLGDVWVNVTVSDASPVSAIDLEYSLNDGATWHVSSLIQQDPTTWTAHLGTLPDSYVSLRANATDLVGNTISQTTIRGFYVRTPYTLADFPVPFVDLDGNLSAAFIMGANVPHGPCGGAYMIDLTAAVPLASCLGLNGSSGRIAAYVDDEVADYDGEHVYSVEVEGNLITYGSSGVNLVTRYFNDLGDELPTCMKADETGVYIYVPATGHRYYMVNDYWHGTNVTDYGMLVHHYDIFRDRYVIIAAGFSGYSTKAAAAYLAAYEVHPLDGTAIIIRYYDEQGDGVHEDVTVVEVVPLARAVTLAPVDPDLTSPSGTYRWLDVADQPYGSDYRDSYNYSQASVDVTFNTIGAVFNGTLLASNLKPNFGYQLKLVGTPGTDDNARIGLAGRWWQETWNGTHWASGANLNNKGDGSSPNPNDVLYFERRCQIDPSSPTGYHYRYTGYLPFDYFVTNSTGDAVLPFQTGSCYHVLWKTSQRSRTPDDGVIKQVTFDPEPSDPAYDDNYPSNTISIFGEWERLPMGGVPLLSGEYSCQIVLTEESFHGSGGAYAGNWAGAMSADIAFTIL